jgi:hypothetical protein
VPSRMNGGTANNSFIRFDALVRLHTIEIRHKFDDTGELLTRIMLRMLALLILESQRTFSTGSSVPWKMSWQSSSK